MFRKKKASTIFFIIQLLSEILLNFALIRSNMIPTRYLVLSVIAAIALLFVSWLLAFHNVDMKIRKQKTRRRTTAAVISLLTLLISLIGFIALGKVGSTLHEISSGKTATSYVGVYVRANDPASKLKDARYYKFGYTKVFDAKNTVAAIDSMEDKLGTRPKSKNFDDVSKMIEALYNGDIDALVLNESYAELIDGQDEYSDFHLKTKIIYEYEFESDAQSRGNKSINTDLSSFVFYLSGSDTTSKTLNGGRSDVNILMTINTETREILLVNTPRDYYVPISVSSSGARDKLTHCGIYGTQCSMDTLGALYGTEVDYFARINFTGFATLIDAVGGITVNADEAFQNSRDNPLLDGSHLVIKKGENTLNGAQALGFARERMTVSGGDNARGVNQMKMITAVIDKMSSVSTILKNYSDILDSLEGMFETDMPSKQITELVKMQLDDMSSWHIHSYAVSGYGGMGVTYSMPGANLYITTPDQSTVDHAAELISRVLAGEHISDEDVL